MYRYKEHPPGESHENTSESAGVGWGRAAAAACTHHPQDGVNQGVNLSDTCV